MPKPEHETADWKIDINGTKFDVAGETITFDQLVRLFYPDVQDTSGYYVTYAVGNSGKDMTPLPPDQAVGLRHGLFFDIGPASGS